MATSQLGQVVTHEAGGDLSAVQYRFVLLASDGQVDQAGLDAIATGVLQNDPSAAGRAAAVAISGIVKVVAGAAVTRGGEITSDASGRAIDIGANVNTLGKALDAASAAGEIIRVQLQLFNA